MPSLANLLEDYRNWRGRQEWESGKGWQDFYGGDPDMQERMERFHGFGTGSHGLSGLSGLAGAIKASHGSPHLFDKFDMSKIGTGEGAQAYGHGLYYAQGFDSPVAKSYKGAGSTAPDPSKDIVGWSKWIMGTGIDESVLSDLLKNGGKNNNEIEQIISSAKQDPGHLYNVSLEWPNAAREAADPLGEHHLLDWDKPLSEQPEWMREGLTNLPTANKYAENFIKDSTKGLNEAGLKKYRELAGDVRQKMSGAKLYQMLMSDFGGDPLATSKALQDLGIPGIKYLDQGSRGAGTGTSNYVMFDENIPKIISRNGVSLTDLLRR